MLVGSRALAIPVARWSGEWVYGKKEDAGLRALAKYLKKTRSQNHIDFGAFQNDILKGLHFKSSIPWGYGLGSSAALTAAIFDVYGRQSDEKPVAIEELATIENFYHGHSSGLDPLVSCVAPRSSLRA